MKRSTWKKRALASALALTMAASVLPMAGFAAGESTVPLAGESGTDGLKMNKTATLEDDGTYTINLEAWATGQVEVETITKVKPCDIVLVLDQSGSMTEEKYYISGIPSGTYSRVYENVSIKQVEEGGYYYLANRSYYRLRVEKEEVVPSVWVGADGKTYTDKQVDNTWTDCYGNTWAIDGGGYYAVPTLKKFHRETREGWFGTTYYRYVNDGNPAEQSTENMRASTARQNFLNEFGKAPYNAQAVDKNNRYSGAQYIPVTQQTVGTYNYTFYYINDAGQKVDVATQSGSRTDNCEVTPLYKQNIKSDEGPRLDALKYAANTFIDNVRANAIVNEVDHRVAVVGFASKGDKNFDGKYNWINTELFVGAKEYNYTQGGKGSDYNTWGNLASDHYDEAFQSVRNTNGYSNLTASIKDLDGEGATYPQYGFDMAKGIFDAYGGQDGEKDRSRVVVFLTDGEPGYSKYEDEAANAAVSAATKVKGYNAKVYTVAVLSSAPEQGSDVDNFLKKTSSDGSYTLATNAQELENFFETMDDEISSTTSSVELTEEALLKDVLGEDFIFPEDYDVNSNVTVQVAPYLGRDTFGAAKTADGVNVGLDGNTINVTGFNYVATENLVTEDGGTDRQPTGNKLIVTIKGVLAKDSAAGKETVSTNSETSGIYDKDKKTEEYVMVKPFPVPQVTIGHSLHVLDYAKEARLPVDGLASVNRLDSSKDSVFSKVSDKNIELNDMTYGNAKVAGGTLSYEPKTMNWDNYDSFYALGKNGGINQWSKVSVMPANNVYYEDDFMVNTEGSGIVYGGSWTTVGTPANNTETPDNDIHGGWVEDDTGLSNDTGFSDGTAHKGNEKGATATFTFTGTGVDVYTHTTSATLNVLARIQGNGVDKVLVMNNQSVSGDYYQIPTLSFMGLDYGTYTVTITTTGTGLYYLDGIRVYNPIQGNGDVDEAYGDEAGAMFQSVRDILLKSGDLTAGGQADGAVFLDTDKDNAVIADYESYGPKNEVYLAKGQSIAFRVSGDTSETVYIGLKSPTGVETTASVTNGTEETANCKVNHTTDLYYKVTTGENGLVVIKNEGTALLSVTKLRTTGNTRVSTLDIPTLMNYMSIMDTLPEVPYGEVSNGSEGEGNVDIENPDQGQETPSQGNSFLDIVKDIFESIWNLF